MLIPAYITPLAQKKYVMATKEQRKTPEKISYSETDEVEEEEREIEDLEKTVKEVAEKILECRRKIPHRILEALSSHLVAQRPQISTSFCSPSGAGENDGSVKEAARIEDPETVEKLQALQSKTANNIATMPRILKRMNECTERIDRIGWFDVKDLHPAFKRKRNNKICLAL